MSGTEVAVDRIRLGQRAILSQHIADRIIVGKGKGGNKKVSEAGSRLERRGFQPARRVIKVKEEDLVVIEPGTLHRARGKMEVLVIGLPALNESDHF